MREDEQTPVHFGRWLLKHCYMAQEDGFLCWSYCGELHDTGDLFEIFKKVTI